MRTLIILLFSLLTISNVKGDYSINSFLNYLQEKGFYELFAEIKYFFGDDVSISFCKDLFPTRDCENVIRVYIPSKTRADRPYEEVNLEQIVEPYLLELRKATGKTNEQILNYLRKYN